LVLLLAGLVSAQAAPVEDVLVSELDRAMTSLAPQSDKPYYVALEVFDDTSLSIQARDGTLADNTTRHVRTLDVDLRVGSPDLDSTHPLRGFSAMEDDSRPTTYLPIDDGEGTEAAMRHAIWRDIDASWRGAREKIVMIRANRNVKVEEEDPAPDFEPRPPIVDRQAVPAFDVDEDAWAKLLVAVDQKLEADPDIYWATVALQATHEVKTFVDTDGTRLVHGRNGLRVSLQAQSTADDGEQVSVFQSRDAHTADKLPTADELYAWARDAVDQVHALRKAPRGVPYSGPVILAGRASGVFFHEVFGHRVEGHRQKRDTEGKTFAEAVGKQILPPFIDVVDDPTVETFQGTDLNGYYAYDDEGVAAQPAVLAKDGKFVGFLMARSPIPGFTQTNGHGRRDSGAAPVSRMGNTIVTADPKVVVPRAKLREQLLAEVRAQHLPYGVIVEEIEGGFTLTGRVEPNAFNVRASESWLVYADGRPDELVRGIDLVGTPLVAFSSIIAAGNDPEVFNGFCGAESGWVPVSAVAPSLLVRRLEFQLKEKGQERPPLLAKPDVGVPSEAVNP
jgi:TldD protein